MVVLVEYIDDINSQGVDTFFQKKWRNERGYIFLTKGGEPLNRREI